MFVCSEFTSQTFYEVINDISGINRDTGNSISFCM